MEAIGDNSMEAKGRTRGPLNERVAMDLRVAGKRGVK